jgi:hypothetical protein
VFGLRLEDPHHARNGNGSYWNLKEQNNTSMLNISV